MYPEIASFHFQATVNPYARTQKSVVRVGLEELLRAVQVETERQEDLYIRLLLQQPLVDLVGALQLANANRIVTLSVALRVQRVEHL